MDLAWGLQISGDGRPMQISERSFVLATLQVGLIVILGACGGSPATDGTGGSTGSSSGGSGAESSGEIDASTGSTGEGETDSTSSGSSSSDTGETTDSDTDTVLPLCDLDAFSTNSAVSIVDPSCNGGDRCSATATCTLASSEGPDPRTGRWRYELSCEGEWTDIDSDETTPEEGAIVVMHSANELELGELAYDYSMSTDSPTASVESTPPAIASRSMAS